jgi:hypothetical protein
MLDEFLGESPCIEEGGGRARDRDGYARASIWIGGCITHLIPHRVSFEKAWGITLKPEQVVRHTCDNTSCVNPLHLQVGTHGDNARDRVVRGRGGVNDYANATHCINGHEFSEENTWHSKTRQLRKCRACRRERDRGMR